jgi:choline dehydrogenase-like flavoprotein
VGAANDALGHYLMDHFTIEHGGGTLPGMSSDRRQPEGRPCGVIIPKYVNVAGGETDKRFLRGFYFFADSRQDLYSHAFRTPGFGDEFRAKVRSQIPWNFSITGQGECLPSHDNYVKLDAEKKDAWGIPVLHIHASYGENERIMGERIRQRMGEIVDALKLENRKEPPGGLSPFGKNIHECGTARMGSDPKKSVVNRFNQVHGVKNLFVTDGACFVTQGCYEPTLTIMAISARTADYIAHEHKRGHL